MYPLLKHSPHSKFPTKLVLEGVTAVSSAWRNLEEAAVAASMKKIDFIIILGKIRL